MKVKILPSYADRDDVLEQLVLPVVARKKSEFESDRR
jgi:hypothetical protein